MALFICALTLLQGKDRNVWRVCFRDSGKRIPQLPRSGNLLGLGDQEGVIEEEEVPLLGLQACLQLCLDVTREKTGWTLGEEGLDQGT